jgi:hypothetical protein
MTETPSGDVEPVVAAPAAAPAESAPTEPAEPPVTPSSAPEPVDPETGTTETSEEERATTAEIGLEADLDGISDDPETPADGDPPSDEETPTGDSDDAPKKPESETSGALAPVEGFVDTMSNNWQKLVTPIGKWAVNSLVEKAKTGAISVMDSVAIPFQKWMLLLAIGKGGPSANWLSEYKPDELDTLEAMVGMRISRNENNEAAVDAKTGAVTVDWVDPAPEMMPAYKTLDVFEHTFGYAWDLTEVKLRDVNRATTWKQLKDMQPTGDGKTATRFKSLIASIGKVDEEDKLEDDTPIVNYIEENADKIKNNIEAAPSYDDILGEAIKEKGITRETSIGVFTSRLRDFQANKKKDDNPDPNYEFAINAVRQDIKTMVGRPKFLRKIIETESGFALIKQTLSAKNIDGVNWDEINAREDLNEKVFSKIVVFLQRSESSLFQIVKNVSVGQALEIARTSEDSRIVTGTMMKVSHFLDETASATGALVGSVAAAMSEPEEAPAEEEPAAAPAPAPAAEPPTPPAE